MCPITPKASAVNSIQSLGLTSACPYRRGYFNFLLEVAATFSSYEKLFDGRSRNSNDLKTRSSAADGAHNLLEYGLVVVWLTLAVVSGW